MSVFKKMEKATDTKDADAYIKLLDDKFEFVRHQSGKTMNKAEFSEMIRKMMASGAMSVSKERLIYENDDILVEHSVMDFPDGTREAVMGVHMLKNGKIRRTETGATLLAKELVS